jgi:hypothetical protein
MNNFNIRETINAGHILLDSTKGHIKKRVLDAVIMLEELDTLGIENIKVRVNVKSLVNCGDVNEILVGQKLNFFKKNSVSLNCNDLPTIRKNEIKFCNNQNALSNRIEDKGFYMGYILNGFHSVVWVNRETVRANKNIIKKYNNRGGSILRNEILNLNV